MRAKIYVNEGIRSKEVVLAGQRDCCGWCAICGSDCLCVLGYLHPFVLDTKNQSEGKRGRFSGKYDTGQHLPLTLR